MPHGPARITTHYFQTATVTHILCSTVLRLLFPLFRTVVLQTQILTKAVSLVCPAAQQHTAKESSCSLVRQNCKEHKKVTCDTSHCLVNMCAHSTCSMARTTKRQSRMAHLVGILPVVSDKSSEHLLLSTLLVTGSFWVTVMLTNSPKHSFAQRLLHQGFGWTNQPILKEDHQQSMLVECESVPVLHHWWCSNHWLLSLDNLSSHDLAFHI